MIHKGEKQSNFERPAKKRRSFFTRIKWDDALQPNSQLQKLPKHRLGGSTKMTQKIFEKLQYQLYATGTIPVKAGIDIATGEDYEYAYSATTGDNIEDQTYMKVIKKLSAEQACKLLIFRYYNLTEPTPPDYVQEIFNTTWTGNTNENVAETRETSIKINENFILQKVRWTKKQRKAVANTRDFFLGRGLGENTKSPFLSDIPFFGNDKFFRNVLIAFLTAKVSPSIICNICESCFINDNLFDESQLENLIFLEDQEEVERNIVNFSGQRNSITVITDEMKRENKAASTIQRAFRQHIQTKIRAVRLIEIWWCQLERERHQVILEIAEEMQEAFDRAHLQVEDVFNWGRFSQEIKDDYKTARHPEPRLLSYWFKVVAIVTLPILGAIEAVAPYHNTFIGINLPTLIFYIFLLYLIQYKDNWYATWIQTLGMWFFTVCILNQLFILRNGWIRVYVWIVIVAIGRQHWMTVFFVTMVIRIIFTFMYDIFTIQPVEYFVFLYDLYSVTTIAAASRQGTPIQMLQKVMINIVMLVIIAASAAIASMVACFHLGLN